jgi:hypothetical protein
VRDSKPAAAFTTADAHGPDLPAAVQRDSSAPSRPLGMTRELAFVYVAAS